MAQGTTLYRVQVALSDVERNVYETLDLRVAQHPSEAMPYLVTRLTAYCLCYAEGIAFSNGGLSTPDEPPVSVRGADGSLQHWIDVGSPGSDRIHRASKAAEQVTIYTTQKLGSLRESAEAGKVHRAASITVQTLQEAWVAALAEALTRKCALELTRTEQALYASLDGRSFEGVIETDALARGED